MKKNREAPREYVIYSRKSRYTGKGESIENQVEMCRRYLESSFGKAAAEGALVYEDEGFSGGTLERPQFKQMMKDSHRRNFAAIVVYRLDRISRNIGDFAGLIQELGDRGIGFISIKEQFDTSSPMGRAMMYIASVFSQLERETIAERIRDNMHELAKTGRWLGGNTPLGYGSEGVTKVTVDGKTKSTYHLVAVPEEQQLVKRIYDKFLETGSLTKTDAYLLESRCHTRRGNDFTRFAIRGILTNPVYMIADAEAYAYFRDAGVELFGPEADFDGTRGVMAYNRTLQRPGRTNQINPMEEWIVALGSHQGLVSGQKWVQVQRMLDQNREKGYRRARNNEALLSGLLICGRCGGFLRPKLTSRVNSEGQRIFTYRCETRDRSRGAVCDMKCIDGNQLDRQILEELERLSRDPEVFVRQLELGRQALERSRSGYDGEIARITAEQKQNSRELETLVRTLPKYVGTELEEDLTGQITRLHARADGLEKQLDELRGMVGESALHEDEFEVLRDAIIRVGSRLDAMSAEQRRVAVRTVVNRVVWDGETAQIYFLADEDGTGRKIQFQEEESVKKDGNPGPEDPNGADSK